jgi:hypothetical protein
MFVWDFFVAFFWKIYSVVFWHVFVFSWVLNAIQERSLSSEEILVAAVDEAKQLF